MSSQANRLEEALLSAWEEHRIQLPVIAVDFSGEEGIADIGRITTLQAPHRIADDESEPRMNLARSTRSIS